MKNEFTVEENRKNACKIQNLAQTLITFVTGTLELSKAFSLPWTLPLPLKND